MKFVYQIMLRNILCTCYRIAGKESISSHIRGTATHRYMIVHIAICISAAYINTRIHTFVIGTGFVLRAVCIICAFWSTTYVWVSKVVEFTCTSSIFAVGISSTRVWAAFIIYSRSWL